MQRQISSWPAMLANGHVCILKPWPTIAFLIIFIIYWLKWCNLCISCRISECACAAASFSLAGKFLIHIVVVASLQVKVLWWKVFELTERLRAMMCNNKSVQLFGSFLNSFFYLTLILLRCIQQPCGYDVNGQLQEPKDLTRPATVKVVYTILYSSEASLLQA